MDYNNECIYKELNQIQSCITRMANNSFYIKGWHITLLIALIAFFFSNEDPNYIVLFALILFVTFMMSYLDAYYLILERKYRWKYEWVIANRIKDDSDSINKNDLFNLDPNNQSMWIDDQNNPGMKAARKSIECKHKSWVKRLRCHRAEIKTAMTSGIMLIQYIFVSIISIIGLTISIIIHFI